MTSMTSSCTLECSMPSTHGTLPVFEAPPEIYQIKFLTIRADSSCSPKPQKVPIIWLGGGIVISRDAYKGA